MRFRVLDRDNRLPSQGVSCAYLKLDYWDDWSKYRTQFQLYLFDKAGVLHELGDVKIGSAGLSPGSTPGVNTRAPHLDVEFEQLPDDYFSLGQNETYYEELGKLTAEERTAVLLALRDLAYDLERFDRVSGETVVNESLLRFVSASNVRTRLHRLAKGDARLTKFEFSYRFPPSNGRKNEDAPPEATFFVRPESLPPSNVHVVIGRNGVGKTRFMQGLTRALLGHAEDEDGNPVGELTLGRDELSPDEVGSFAGLVCVSFSAFDDFQVPESKTSLKCEVVGLRKGGVSSTPQVTLSPDQLADSFSESLEKCRKGLKRERWQHAVKSLYTDPVFSDANPLALLDIGDQEWDRKVNSYFRKRLSSGHKIVLLSITRLVELVEERTLVLLDEPEGHLHPPPSISFYPKSFEFIGGAKWRGDHYHPLAGGSSRSPLGLRLAFGALWS